MESYWQKHEVVRLHQILYRCLTFIMLFVTCPVVLAGNWLIEPSLSLTGIITDNLMLAPPGQEFRGYVGRAVPSISVQGTGNRASLDAYYQMENLTYPNRDKIFRNSTTYHQANASGNIELARDLFFLKGAGRFYQETLNPDDRISYDNINPVGNKGNILSLTLTPYIKHDFGTKMHVDALYERGHVDSRATGGQFDADTNRYQFRIDNHLSSSLYNWEINYQKLNEKRATIANTSQESAYASLYYRIADNLSVLIRNRYENNDIHTSRNIVNGNWLGAGILWEPGSKLSLEAIYGNRGREADIKWRPNARTTANLAYNNKDIGLNPGVSWSMDLAYRMRRSAINISYFEEVTSYQYLQLQQGNQIPLLDIAGNPVVDPVTNLPLYTVDQILGLTNENFLRENGTISMSYKTRRVDMSLSVYAESRKYEQTIDVERIYGVNAAWKWHFSKTMNLLLQGEGQRRKKDTDLSGDNFGVARLALTRRLSQTLSGAVEARYTRRDAMQTDLDFIEKRFMVSIIQQF